MAADLVFLISPWIEGSQLTWTLCNQGDAPVPQWSSVGEYKVWPNPPGNSPAFPEDNSRATLDIAPKDSFEASVDISSWGYNLNQGIHKVQIRIQHPDFYLRELEFEVKGTLLHPIGEPSW